MSGEKPRSPGVFEARVSLWMNQRVRSCNFTENHESNHKVGHRKRGQEVNMEKIVYVSKSSIERKSGPLRIAHLPGESQPVIYSVHGAIAQH